jgi:hypothetical protein
MSPSARSVRVFSFYLLLLGGANLLAPNRVLLLFGMPPTQEVWLRVVGMLLLMLSYYFFRASGAEMRDFLRWTSHGRLAAPVCFTAFVLLGLAPPILILFGVVDAAGAVWTLACLRREGRDEMS